MRVLPRKFVFSLSLSLNDAFHMNMVARKCSKYSFGDTFNYPHFGLCEAEVHVRLSCHASPQASILPGDAKLG